MTRFTNNHSFAIRLTRRAIVYCLAAVSVVSVGCNEIKQATPEPYFASTARPLKQEFRWSNGKLPSTSDPAFAAASPETDLVRAVYEGLVELDGRTLRETPAAAESWTAADDLLTWTFIIRENARWSDGSPLTAEDFRRSWIRAAKLGRSAPHSTLFRNIAGLSAPEQVEALPIDARTSRMLNSVRFGPNGAATPQTDPADPPRNDPDAQTETNTVGTPEPSGIAPANDIEGKVGITATDERTLVVKLISPDPDFPKLTAHPIFRPVHQDDLARSTKGLSTVTNGPFRIVSFNSDGIGIERSDTYWNRIAVKLERVKFIPAESAEKALEAYRTGAIDAVTNADFSPLVLKLLTPYDDFRKTTFAAINFYEVNVDRPHLNDRRVREALAIAIERERLTDGELEGTTQPALTFTPFGSATSRRLVQDKERARDLLEDAGFPNGRDFPTLKLVVNRNDTQQRIARSVATMWKQVLNIDSEIVIKEASEMDKIRNDRDFDLLRRGVVLPTIDEKESLSAIFGASLTAYPANPATARGDENTTENGEAANRSTQRNSNSNTGAIFPDGVNNGPFPIDSHDTALYELRAIPLYFPMSYSLVRPYVLGFETNSLDAPYLLNVSIDETWKP